MVDEALRAARAVQSRLRDLPSRVVIYLILAACLFPEVGYPGVWRKLTGALAGLPVAAPTASALAQARRRVGSKPLRWLFDLLRGPAATPYGPAVRWRGLLVVALDGTTLTVPDSPAVLTRFTKQAGNHGGTGYPQVRLLALVACGTRTLIDAVLGPTTTGETTYAPRLLPSLRPGMILLADRNFAAQGLLSDITATGSEVLVRLKNGRRMPVLARYPDGSYLSTLGPVTVRVIDCEITITTTAGKHTGLYRLATTLLDHHRYPAGELATLYHQRWEVETAYLELKSIILGSRVLRARTPEGITQEIYALLVVYQLLRTAMADATSTRPGTGPDRAGFSIAWQAARDQVILAAGVICGTVIDLVGTIGPTRPGQPPAPASVTRQPPDRQTRHVQVPGTRPPHRPDQLQSHRQHRHPRAPSSLTTPPEP
ncbi:IS4 family transposase [Streptomyces violaceusniger]|uniref:Transposase IS4 family protein n=1 Tax=Streptomyces violaceusniger (strain Tu 4113) TaxID=653045 RepID=G2P482_STRV4|nr:IS4 family transposase [Streptomyces violaceusniger]AEM85010.1 transposase IS4 family protein [Streptomyces violaceusniger Tu 4113]